jgi:2-amino-4-hydroxy-6-hydroxymethyldihydropteridine diphosphokinase
LPGRSKTGPSRVYVALGSNLGDRERALGFAREQLAALPGTVVRAVSSIEETAPLGERSQPMYLNQMVVLDTSLSPRELLAALQRIEVLAGRARRERWESRILDLDIVRFGNLEIDEPDLKIPHPGLRDRDFWQRELGELAGPGFQVDSFDS